MKTTLINLQIENIILRELQNEYDHILRLRKLNLQKATLMLSDSKSKWAEYDPLTHVISISRNLLKLKNWFIVCQVLKHEIAHQVVYETYKSIYNQLSAHGAEFQKACEQLAVPHLFRKASVDEISFLDFNKQELNLEKLYFENLEKKEESPFLNKVNKLLSLAQSQNENEAELALLKAQDLIAKYNLDISNQLQNDKNFYHFVIRTDKQKFSVFEKKLISILTQFYFVQAVIIHEFSFNLNKKVLAVELIGDKENVLMAEYVFHFLNRVCLDLYAKFKTEQSRSISFFQKKKRTIRNRDSFLIGLLEGFYEKLAKNEELQADSVKQEIQSKNINSMIEFRQRNEVIGRRKKELNHYLKNYFPHLKNVTSGRRSFDKDTFDSAKEKGRKISIHQPVSSREQSQIGYTKK